MGKVSVRALALLFPTTLFLGGCNGLLGIEEKTFNPDATADAGFDSSASGYDATRDTYRFPDAPVGTEGAPSDAPAFDAPDAIVSSCAADGSAGSVCGQVTYGAWSACSYAATCDNSGSRTRSVITPTCVSGACSNVMTTDTDMAGCARDTTGTICAPHDTCQNQMCLCAPACAGKNCGPDGCGGSCGNCTGNYTCNGMQVCQCNPTPGCVQGGDVGAPCAPDDGCGGPCTCNTMNGESCQNGSCCHQTGWACLGGGGCCNTCDTSTNTCT